jgi:hypothetical protein
MQDEMALGGCGCTIALMEGRFEDAHKDADAKRRAALTLESEYDLFVAPFGSAGRAALWARDADAARAALEVEATTHIRTPWYDCRVAGLRAGIAALEGDERAAAMFEEALRDLDAVDIPLSKALCQTDFSLLVGGEAAASASEEAKTFWSAAGNEHVLGLLETGLPG